MSVSISIVPFSKSLDLYGEPDRHAAYSLSGYVEISLSSSFYTSYFERRRVISILLQSLVVTLEGQTELVTEETGYSALRLCSVSEQLVTDEPIELSNDGNVDDAGTSTWNVVFNLTVPGWLPETAKFGQSNSGTRYTLHASATLNNGDSSSSSSWFSTFCSPFRPQTRIIKAPHIDIELNRFRSPPESLSESESLWHMSHYAVTPELEAQESPFPIDLLSQLRVQVSAPHFVGMDENSIPFSLRLRTDGLSESECKKLRISDFNVELEQCERYRMLPLDAYVKQYPVPPRSQQPPRVPLLDPLPVQAVYELGLANMHPTTQNITRSFSLLPKSASGHYVIAGDGYAFRGDAGSSRTDSWFSLQTSVGVARHTQSSKEDSDDLWHCRRTLRPSAQSPFLGVIHRMYVTLTCTYDLTEGENPERVTRHIRVLVPLRFTRTLAKTHSATHPSSPTMVGSSHSLGDCSTSNASSIVDLPKVSSPYASSLPAYSQLFYANGDRKIDYSIPLPLYTPS
ncbi:hypothetical protein BDY19DRAFT_872140, partial [Irpex rosettiformis]